MQKTEYAVSVVIPVYNVARYLKRCVDSVLSQTLKEVEVILVSDGPDDCHAICDDYANRSRRVKVIKNCGSYSKSVNAGIDTASGEYIGIVESDDWCHPQMFEKLYLRAVAENADIVKCLFYKAYDDKLERSKGFGVCPPQSFDVAGFPQILSYQPTVWSAVYKKSFLNRHAIRFMDEGRLAFVDSPFQYETFCKAGRISLLPEYLYYYFQDNENASTQASRRHIADGIIAEEYAYRRLEKVLQSNEALYGAFMAATLWHLRWHIRRVDEEYKPQVWARCRQYLQKLRDVPAEMLPANDRALYLALAGGISWEDYERQQKKKWKFLLFGRICLFKFGTTAAGLPQKLGKFFPFLRFVSRKEICEVYFWKFKLFVLARKK